MISCGVTVWSPVKSLISMPLRMLHLGGAKVTVGAPSCNLHSMVEQCQDISCTDASTYSRTLCDSVGIQTTKPF